MKASIPLRTYRLNPRKARLAISDTLLAIHLPTYFGRKSWTVLLDEVAVCDLTHVGVVEEKANNPDVVFQQNLSIPYFFTTGPVTSPTLALLFSHPLRVPPLRLVVAVAPNTDLPFGYRASRSTSGASIDGTFLRAVDPAAATELLCQAGAEVTNDPEDWLRRHRQTVTDPEIRARLLEEVKRKERLTRVSNWGFGLALGSLALSDRLLPSNLDGTAIGIAVAAGVVGLGARLVARRAATP